MNSTCWKCHRALSSADSVKIGIGPICRAKIQREQTAAEAARQANLACHHGFVCSNPEHAATTMTRFQHRLRAILENVGLADPSWRQEIRDLTERADVSVATVNDALGLYRPRLGLPTIGLPKPDACTLTGLGVPPTHSARGTSYDVPADWQQQYKHKALHQLGICPHGLDCRDPAAAVAAIWRLLDMMRSELEPRLRANWELREWSWDHTLYQGLYNTLQCLGLQEEGELVCDEVERMRRRARKRRG